MQRSMTGDRSAAARRRAALGTIVFASTVPGTVVGLIPRMITGWRLAPPLFPGARPLGVVLLAGGAPLFVEFLRRFVRDGVGTPAPIAPTRHLVTGGIYRVNRNPGYVAVLAMLLGQALVFGSWRLCAYTAAVSVAFHLFVVLYEEPTLRRQFGPAYDRYRSEVPRWLPRFPSAR
jgi:protein-S-isoprenylcysteine O-methyltransferase Ste14